MSAPLPACPALTAPGMFSAEELAELVSEPANSEPADSEVRSETLLRQQQILVRFYKLVDPSKAVADVLGIIDKRRGDAVSLRQHLACWSELFVCMLSCHQSVAGASWPAMIFPASGRRRWLALNSIYCAPS